MSRHPSSRHGPSALLRLLAVYLSLILALQGIAAAAALGAGPLHRHSDTAPSVASLAFSHHGHAHATGQRHVHAAADASVLAIADAEDSMDALAFALAFALTSALSLLALDTPRRVQDAGAESWPPTGGWIFSTAYPSPLFKPPRQA